ncbi:microsomal glutathione S-transferase 1 [Tribolium castaneum]|nr:PREDICTED: microsomal glutathione S-transferase 1-like [Tribolium castaneum]AFM57704.1 microsomal glutathione S-transferase-like protein [Tribolium castaneum]|eukprot:XP_015836904.1 PREDICTED: microsomal glutathione S-transferase 1-like [Tribolium castaneum]
MVNTTSSAGPPDSVLTLNNPAFGVYLISACLLVLKMMGMSLLTIYNRFKYKAFICPEDAKWLQGQVVSNDTVERVRRAHQNDLENIPIFLAAAFAYLWTQPPAWLAWVLYLGFTILRALHTIVYTLIVLPQPTRALLWVAGYLLTGYMAVHAALHVFIYLIM